MPKFSILIPIIKGRFLYKAISSVLKQSFSDWELILYNDCSQDNIDNIARKFNDKRIKYYKGDKNLGMDDPSKTWNHILTMAKGQYFCLLGDDDLISENYLEEMKKMIAKYPKVNLLRARLKRIDENGTEIMSGEELPEFETWKQMMYQRNVKKRLQSTCEFVVNRESLLKIGGYVHFPRACGSDDATYLLLTKDNGVASTNNTFGFWRKSSLNISDNDSEEVNKYKLSFLLKWEKNFLDRFFLSHVPIHEIYKILENKLLELSSTKSEPDTIRTELSSKKAELERIYLSREWHAVLILRKIAKIIIPKGSSRRKTVVILWKKIKVTTRLFHNYKNRVINLVILKKYLDKKPRLKKHRKINLKSKKIICIDHSHHNKTKSNTFLTDYLKQIFDVKIVWDESWHKKGDTYPDLSFVDYDYLGVIFFQSLPRREVLDNIKNDNLIFFPMYDGISHDFGFWKDYYDLKIVNFSKTLHDKLKKWGFDSIYVQYFPEPQEFNPGKIDEVFFWQRISKIDINTIKKLFKKEKVKLHIHKAVDPNHKFIQPSTEDERRFNITYSDWFDTKEEMWDLIKQKGLYVAPRECEGIGQSFLEAMAMGKAVIAANNPTMNEYIKYNETGYLFDLANTKEINLSDIKRIQKNTYEYMVNGYKKWEKNKSKIIDFIKHNA